MKKEKKKKKEYKKPRVKTEQITLGVFGDYNNQNSGQGIGGFTYSGWGS